MTLAECIEFLYGEKKVKFDELDKFLLDIENDETYLFSKNGCYDDIWLDESSLKETEQYLFEFTGWSRKDNFCSKGHKATVINNNINDFEQNQCIAYLKSNDYVIILGEAVLCRLISIA